MLWLNSINLLWHGCTFAFCLAVVGEGIIDVILLLPFSRLCLTFEMISRWRARRLHFDWFVAKCQILLQVCSTRFTGSLEFIHVWRLWVIWPFLISELITVFWPRRSEVDWLYFLAFVYFRIWSAQVDAARLLVLNSVATKLRRIVWKSWLREMSLKFLLHLCKIVDISLLFWLWPLACLLCTDFSLWYVWESSCW